MNEIRDLIIGIDFGKEDSQICYYDRNAKEPRSLSMKVGSAQYEAPTRLCRRVEQGDYCVGLEAEYFAREKGGFLVENLYDACKKEDPVLVSGEQKEPWELLSYFLKGMLKFLGVMEVIKNTKCLVITSPSLGEIQVKNYQKACESLGIPSEKYLLMDHGESFFYYILTQKREMWNRGVAWYSFKQNEVSCRRLVMNFGTKPALVKLGDPSAAALSEGENRDQEFCDFIKETIGMELLSSVQITGKGFDQEWAKESVKQLCHQKRKVFYGTNLFARGACAAGVERTENKALKGYQYLSDSLVLTDIGMDMRVMGSPAYYPLIESGKNWYECKAYCEFILDDVKELVFVVNRPLENGEKKRIAMALPGLPVRPNKTTRLSLSLAYTSTRDCQIQVKDLGFGDMFPGSGKIWKESVQW